MKSMSGLDGLFLHLETPATPMHVAALYVLEPPPGKGADFAGEVERQLLPRLGVVAVLSCPAGALAAAFRQSAVG
jgi:diacylglycerol O-acyltransferase